MKCIVSLPFLSGEIDSVDVLIQLRKFEINKAHLLAPAKGKSGHDGLQKVCGTCFAKFKWTDEHLIEDFKLFHSSCDTNEAQLRIQVLERVYDRSASQRPS